MTVFVGRDTLIAVQSTEIEAADDVWDRVFDWMETPARLRVDTIRSQVYIRPANVSPRHLALSVRYFPADKLFRATHEEVYLSNRITTAGLSELLRAELKNHRSELHCCSPAFHLEATSTQRRYPPGTSRTETLVLRVANHFGRNEP